MMGTYRTGRYEFEYFLHDFYRTIRAVCRFVDMREGCRFWIRPLVVVVVCRRSSRKSKVKSGDGDVGIRREKFHQNTVNGEW